MGKKCQTLRLDWVKKDVSDTSHKVGRNFTSAWVWGEKDKNMEGGFKEVCCSSWIRSPIKVLECFGTFSAIKPMPVWLKSPDPGENSHASGFHKVLSSLWCSYYFSVIKLYPFFIFKVHSFSKKLCITPQSSVIWSII